ncbi:MAG: HPr family phosphocarrier protein [Clostridia bacterium]|nr:HPr family phosphocarrier protein [Clostridia bacterium]
MAEEVKTVKVLINTIDKVKDFVRDTSQFDADMDLISGRYVIDAKSILGLFSLDLSKPLDLEIHASEPELSEILTALHPYIVSE